MAVMAPATLSSSLVVIYLRLLSEFLELLCLIEIYRYRYNHGCKINWPKVSGPGFDLLYELATSSAALDLQIIKSSSYQSRLLSIRSQVICLG